MKRKASPMDSRDCRERDYYRTGQTAPPRHQSGLVAILLVLVVFLSGMTSILSILNIKLFSRLQNQQLREPAMTLAKLQEDPAPAEDIAAPLQDSGAGLGITVEAITAVYQRHFQLPEGLFVTSVAEGSDAQAQGLEEGDVLLSLNGTDLSSEAQLHTILAGCGLGDKVDAKIYRGSTDETMTLRLTVEAITKNET